MGFKKICNHIKFIFWHACIQRINEKQQAAIENTEFFSFLYSFSLNNTFFISFLYCLIKNECISDIIGEKSCFEFFSSSTTAKISPKMT